MDVAKLLQQHVDLMDDMFKEGLLDEQFNQLQQLQDESNPNFLEEVVSLFFEDSQRILENMTETIGKDPIDYKVIDSQVHQFKGSSSSIGAQRVKNVCVTFRTCCDKEDKKGCQDTLEEVGEEYNLIKKKLETMLELEKQIVAIGGTLPFMEGC
ncbi:unnamed protein product [Sphagnum jensenii]|uniref:Histidine-containing phosphotransfer protein n=1 Tax=Sphagnum jensenii TaxID=128206 RepID=A0ABP1BH51_9BRYO